MSQAKRVAVIAGVLLLVTLEATAQTPEVTPPAEDLRPLVEEVLKLYGVPSAVEQIPALLETQLEQGQGDYPPEIFATLRSAFGEAFRSEALYQTMVERVARDADRSRLEAARAFLTTPLGQKLVGLESKANAENSQEGMKEFADQFNAGTPEGRARLELVQQLDQAAGSTEIALTMTVETVRAVVTAVQPLLPPDKRLSGGELEEEVNGLEAQLQSSMRYATWLGLLYTYREASDEELETYLDFSRSAEGRWLNRATGDAFIEAVRTAGREAARRIAAEAGQRRAAR